MKPYKEGKTICNFVQKFGYLQSNDILYRKQTHPTKQIFKKKKFKST